MGWFLRGREGVITLVDLDLRQEMGDGRVDEERNVERVVTCWNSTRAQILPGRERMRVAICRPHASGGSPGAGAAKLRSSDLANGQPGRDGGGGARTAGDHDVSLKQKLVLTISADSSTGRTVSEASRCVSPISFAAFLPISRASKD